MITINSWEYNPLNSKRNVSKANLLGTEDERFIANSKRNVWQLIDAVTVYYGLSIWTWQALAQLPIINQKQFNTSCK